MKNIFVLLFAFLFIGITGNAQFGHVSRYELTGGIGATHIFGDIGGFSRGENLIGLKDLSFKQTSLNISAGVRYRILENVSARVSLAAGSFRSTDERGSNENRGFESNSLFLEPTLTGEYYILRNNRNHNLKSSNQNPDRSFFSLPDVYVFTGIGGISYKINPNSALEPRVSATRGFTAVIPAGAGISMNYSDAIKFGIELSGRYSFSDDIDGYTSVYSKSKDAYYFFNLTMGYRIGRAKALFD